MEELRDLDLNLLPALHALLQEHSVTRAAARMGLSTPAMSQTLSRLRTALGDPLLVRAGRGMVPSPRAESLRPRVEAVLRGVGALLDPGDEFTPATSTRAFRVLASDYVVLALGVALDQLVSREAPDVGLRLMPNTQRDSERVRQGEADLAIGVFHGLPPEVRIRKLFEERLVCVVRDDHPGVRQRLSVEQYTAMRHIQVAPRGRPGGLVDDVLARKGRSRQVVRQVPFFFAGLVLASRSDYVLTLPRRLAVAMAARFGLRILALPLGLGRYAVSQIWHPRHDADAGHRWLRGRIVAACAETRPSRTGAAA